MGDKSKIEWLRGPDGLQGASWNPIRAKNKATGGVGHFCIHKTEACRYCYAERLQPRFQNDIRYAAQDRDKVDLFLDEEKLLEPLRWKRPRSIFPCSMTDLLLEHHPVDWIAKCFAVMGLADWHTYIVLTKRGSRLQGLLNDPPFQGLVDRTMDEIAPAHWCKRDLDDAGGWPLKNVWIGVSCHDQASANEIIPQLLATPAAVRFISAEPLLGPIDLRTIISPEGPLGRFVPFNSLARQSWVDQSPLAALDWVIVGGESGRGDAIRPMHPEWARQLRDQCAEEGVPFFFKQWGEYLPVGQILPGYGMVHGATAVKPGRMKLHYGGTPKHAPLHAFVERGVEFTSTADGLLTFRVGKVAAGRRLDGVEHNGMPAVRR